MSKLYQNLSIRYRNSIKYIDDYGIKGIILFNETTPQMRKMWVKFKISKLSFVESIERETIGLQGQKFTYQEKIFKINIIEFVKYALNRGYDWKLFGQPEWEAIEPKKKTKFMKPKIRRNESNSRK